MLEGEEAKEKTCGELRNRRLFVATAQTNSNDSLPEMGQRPGKCRVLAAGYTFPSLPLGPHLIAEWHLRCAVVSSHRSHTPYSLLFPEET